MPNQKACDPKTIALFLNDELDAAQQAEFLAHLDSCRECRSAIDNASADEGFWKEVVRHLSPDSHSGFLVDATSDPSGIGGHHESTRDEDAETTEHSLKSLLHTLSPTDDPEMLGRIAEYEISGVVGVGGMGAVLKGFDKSLMRVVAIKVLAPHLADRGTARKRFEREARAAAAISHDNVCDIYRVDELHGLPYLVMPFARGPSLQKRIDQSGPLSTIEVVLVGKQIASGLAAAHEQGLVHRDIKPANILLNDGVERILITDFGVARTMDEASMTLTGLIAGTPQYMSPEQARGEIVDQRSDLFSLGALLYTVCTGRPPFRAETPFGILRKITDTEPRSILEINPEIPSWLVATIDRLLEKDPSHRFESAKEVAELLEKCLAHLRQPNQIPLPKTVVDLPTKRLVFAKPKTETPFGSRVFRRLSAAVAILVVGLLGVLSFLHFTEAPDISGNWQGESWTAIKLKSVNEAAGWYAGNFVDAEGNGGAIHLEWSRLERRYKGRWSIDADKAGSIVVRPDSSDAVRGAISWDSDSVAEYAKDRLRDFRWQASQDVSGLGTGSNDAALTASSEIPVRQMDDVSSPDVDDRRPSTNGQSRALYAAAGIVRDVSDKIANGAIVRRGEFILSIETQIKEDEGPDEETLQLEKRLASVRHRLPAVQLRQKHLVKQRDLAVAKATADVDLVVAKQVSQRDAVAAVSKEINFHENMLDNAKALFNKGFITKKQLDESREKLDVAKAKLKTAQSKFESLEHDLKVKRLEIEEIENQAQAEIDAAKSDEKNVLLEIEALVNDKKAFKSKPPKFVKINVVAPCEGVIYHWKNLTPGQKLEYGDLILQIQASEKPADPNLNASRETGEDSRLWPRDAGLSSEFNLGSMIELLKFVSELEERLGEVSDRLYQEEETIVQTRKKLKRLENELELVPASEPEGDMKQDDVSNRTNDIRDSLKLTLSQLEKQEMARDHCRSDFESVLRQLNSSTNMISAELDSTKRRYELAGQLAQNVRSRYETGDCTIAEVQKAELRSSSLSSRVEQLSELFENIQRLKSTYAPSEE